MKCAWFAVAAGLLLAGAARAEVKSQEVEYKQGDTVLQGFYAYDDAVKDRRPGVLVIHEWWGHNQHARNQALRLAQAGYPAFAVDMYGKGKLATHPKDAQAFVEEATKDVNVLVARFDAGLAWLKQQPQVDPEKLAAIGYCFGGSVALGMARAGADLDAVAAFHAHLGSETPAQPGKVKAQILVQTGEADPMVPKDSVEAFRKEMADAGVKAEVVSYPGAKHSFTNPDADKVGMDGLGYDKDVDQKSWDKLLAFFKEAFGA